MVRSGVILVLAAVPVITITITIAMAAATAEGLDIELGRSLFDRSWVSAPASTMADDGLGPLFNASSCLGCHVADSPYRAPQDAIHPGIVIRLGTARGEGDPVYGHQVQTRGVQGQKAEAVPDIVWSEANGLRQVELSLHRLGYGPLAPETRAALRRAPNVAGVGLLARVPEQEILARVESGAARDARVSGRPSWIVDHGGNRRLGRFGWKAGQPDLTSQTEMASSRDLGMSTPGQPDPWGECSAAQALCRAAPHGAEPGGFEIPATSVGLIVGYLESLPPPVATFAANSARGRGQARFDGLGCAACHATLHLADGTEVPAYTDLLLHDLGPGLDDGIKEGAAEPGEWRTAPLWGLSASLKLGGLLHDGRAPDVEQAIGWHGGEAAGARARFAALSAQDKAELVEFVSGL